MDLATVSFRLPVSDRDELDAIAASMERDRSYLLKEAVTHYLQWAREEIRVTEEAIASLDRGEGIPHDRVFSDLEQYRRQAQRKRTRKAS